MALQQDRTNPQHIDGLREEVVRRRGIRAAAQPLQLLENVPCQWMLNRFRIDAQIEPGQSVGVILGAGQRPPDIEQFLLGEPNQRPTEKGAERSEGHTSALQPLMPISYALIGWTKKDT